MAWTTMHFAVGMGCAGAATIAVCAIRKRGWRWLPATMTLGGIWAFLPDAPRFFREDFPNLPFASTLGSKTLERALHAVGDLFFFHRSLDAQPHELALHGLVLIILFYNLAIAQLMWLEHRQRNSLANRTWRAHGSHGLKRRRRVATHASTERPPHPTDTDPPDDTAPAPVLYRIKPSREAQGQ